MAAHARLLQSLRLISRVPALRDVARCIEANAAAACLRGYASAASEAGPIYGAVVLERLPVILPEEADWVRERREWQEQFQLRTRKQYPAEFWDKSRRGKSESAEEAAMGWAPGPRVTEADRAGDVKSLRRRLEDRLVLLVKGQGATASESVWQLPAARHEGGETIRDTAERAAAATLPDGLKVYFVGNAPAGHFPDRTPPADDSAVNSQRRSGGRSGRGRPARAEAPPGAAVVSEPAASPAGSDAAGSLEARGASSPYAEVGGDMTSDSSSQTLLLADDRTTFFVKAQLIKGSVRGMRRGSGYLDWAWVSADEVPRFVGGPDLQRLLEALL